MWVTAQGITIAESTVRQLVREQRQTDKPAYLPLEFAPGERAEFDFGHAQVNLNGELVQVPFLAGRLRFSGAMFVEVFPTERQEAFLLGQRHAFEFWGGVPVWPSMTTSSQPCSKSSRGIVGWNKKPSATFTASIALKRSLPQCGRAGRKAAWRIW